MKSPMKWTLRLAGGLLGVVVLALAAVYGVSEYRMSRTYDVSPAPLAYRPAPGDLAEGERLLVTRGCVDCHGKDLGGNVVADDPVVIRLVGTNLTRGKGGVGADRTEQDWVRAIRHGVHPDGRPLRFMPSHEFYPIGDEDLGKMIAYVESVPPVDRELPEMSVGPVGRALYLAGQMHLLPAEMIDHTADRDAPPAPGATAEYGAYLATGCVGCHGDELSGGKIPGAPPEFPAGANITQDPETGIGEWTEADFFRAMRTGKRPDGSGIDPFMPWQNFGRMTDEELKAIWLYLETVPAKPYGNR